MRLTLLLVTATVALAGNSHSIERYRLQILPDIGHGGKAVRFSNAVANQGDGPIEICGYFLDPQNKPRMAVWTDFTRQNNNLRLHAFLSLGAPSIGNDLLHNPDGSITCVGSATNLDGRSGAVVCLLRADGSTTQKILVDPRTGWQATEAVAIDQIIDPFRGSQRIIVGNSEGPGGLTSAIIWREIQPDVFEARPLPSSPQGKGHVMDVAIVPSRANVPEIVCVGSVTMAGSNSSRAAKWRSLDGGETWAFKNHHPGGSESMFNKMFVGADDGTIYQLAVGDARTGNRYHGWFDIFTEIPRTLFADGSQNTSGLDGYRSRLRTWILGEAWDGNSANRKGNIWIEEPTGGEFHARTINDMILSPEGNGFDFQPSSGQPGLLVGRARMPFGPGSFPAICIADGVHLPENLSVFAGDAQGRPRDIDLWHSGDGNVVTVRPDHEGNIGVMTRTMVDRVPQGGMIEVQVRTKVTGPGNPIATMDMQFFNWTTHQWETLATAIVGDQYDVYHATANASHYDPNTGYIFLRTFLTRGSPIRQHHQKLDSILTLIR